MLKKTSECYNSADRRLRQLRRCLLIIDLIQSRRFGISIDDLVREVRENLDDYCQRTIRRDLESLELLAFVEPRRTERGVHWVWLGGHQTKSIERAAQQLNKPDRVGISFDSSPKFTRTGVNV